MAVCYVLKSCSQNLQFSTTFPVVKEKVSDGFNIFIFLEFIRFVASGLLPPGKRVLTQHIRRINYQVAIWELANIAQPDIPTPTEGHGWRLNGRKLEPFWFDEDIWAQGNADMGLHSDIDAHDWDSDDADDEVMQMR